eukprot:5238261-Pleurochrysis_carterae.AAC.1
MGRDSEDKCLGAYLWHNCSIARVTSSSRRSVPSSSELARVLNWAMVSCGSQSSIGVAEWSYRPGLMLGR